MSWSCLILDKSGQDLNLDVLANLDLDLVYAPDNVFTALSVLFQAFFIHEDFTFDVLCCAFMPLLKGALKNNTQSGNYRAIAISSLVLKILDNAILILYGDLLGSDFLQFGYKKNTSGTQCSWLALEVVSYYNRKNTTVKCATLDCSKAFDNCKFSTLFSKVLTRGVPAIIVRGFLAIYQKQRCWVCWSANQTKSRQFGITNGTRQGSCLSPCLFSVYLDELLQELRDSGVGCHVSDVYTGAGCFADDLILLSPSRDSLQKQLQICETYAARHNLLFSTDPDPKKSKSKCIFFHQHQEQEPKKVWLCGKPLPWVPQGAHLGHMLHESGNQELCCSMARAAYIGNSSEIINMFEFATPAQILTSVQIYSFALYGSVLWDLYGPAACKLYRSWSSTCKLAYTLPPQCRTYFVDHYLAGPLPSLKQVLIRRYVQFVQKLVTTANPVISQVAHLSVQNVRSVSGLNFRNIREEFGKDPLNFNKWEFIVEKAKLPENGQQNIDLLDCLLKQRSKEVDSEIICEFDTLIFDICTT